MNSANWTKRTFNQNPKEGTDQVFLGNGIHGLCLFKWDRRRGVWNFKNSGACWWEMSPITMSIDQWRLPNKPVLFGDPGELWKGEDLGKY